MKTKAEAIACICPFFRHPLTTCMADGCMAWQWRKKIELDYGFNKETGMPYMSSSVDLPPEEWQGVCTLLTK